MICKNKIFGNGKLCSQYGEKLDSTSSSIINAKKIIFFICFLFVFVGTTTFAQKVGEKVYKEVVVDNQRENKWLEVYSITEFNEKGKRIHCKDTEGEEWYEYDDKGNEIHLKNFDLEIWKKYDDKGNDIYWKFSDGTEHWYEFNNKGNKIHAKFSDGKKQWYEYDDKDNLIHFKRSDGYEEWNKYNNTGNLIQRTIIGGSFKAEIWLKYDENGILVHENNSEGFEWWYEYKYWSNGKIKQEIIYSVF